MIVRPDEEIFFANAASLRKVIRAELAASDRTVQTILLDLASSNEIDVPGAEMLEELHRDLEALEIRLLLADVHTPVQDMLERSGVTEKIGAEHCSPTRLDAILAVAREKMDHLTADEVVSVLNRIDTLTEIISTASQRVSEENKAKLNKVLEKLGEVRDHLEVG